MSEHSKWECFCDESYYSKWAVRNENDKSFQASIHVGTQKEAEFLVTSLNNLQQYREALERGRIMATEAYLNQDGKSIVAASDFKEIEILLENALKLGDK